MEHKIGFAVIVFVCLVQPACSSSRIFAFLTNVFGMNQYEPSTWPPSFCNGLDCPRFNVVETHDNYEVRRYNASRWVSTTLTDVSYDSAQYNMFMKLFYYISGQNVRSEKINMTCPVINRIIPGQGPACESNFTMSFYVPPGVADPPAPNDTTVFLNSKPEMTVYVTHFGGFASQDDYVNAAAALAQALPEGTSYHTDFWYAVGYDSPFKLLNRRNEVWFIGM